jgi:hypothetical protein
LEDIDIDGIIIIIDVVVVVVVVVAALVVAVAVAVAVLLKGAGFGECGLDSYDPGYGSGYGPDENSNEPPTPIKGRKLPE